MSTKPYSFEPMSVETAQAQAREQARNLNAGRYTIFDGDEICLPAHLMVEDTRRRGKR